jgi:hypothetical protein
MPNINRPATALKTPGKAAARSRQSAVVTPGRTDTDEDLALARFGTRDLAHLHHLGAAILL